MRTSFLNCRGLTLYNRDQNSSMDAAPFPLTLQLSAGTAGLIHDDEYNNKIMSRVRKALVVCQGKNMFFSADPKTTGTLGCLGALNH